MPISPYSSPTRQQTTTARLPTSTAASAADSGDAPSACRQRSPRPPEGEQCDLYPVSSHVTGASGTLMPALTSAGGFA